MKRQALTLVELLIVIAIIGVLVALVIPVVRGGRSMLSTASCFSSGERVGTVLKVSYKGNFTKAWSVEVALQGTGAVWETDVKDNDVALVAKFRRAARVGKLVEVPYVQPSEENMDYHYSTPYRATDVKLLTEDGGTIDIKVTEEDINAVRRLMQ